MGMFFNYKNITENYVPNNIISSFPVGKSYTKLDPIKASKPYEEYDVKGNLIGYFWRYGESLNLEFNIDGEITVEDDAILLTAVGETPSSQYGKVGLRAYNVVDKRSWTCTSATEGSSVWTEDEEFTFSDCGKSVYVTASDYLAGKQVEFKIYNFRMETVYSQIFEGSTQVIVPITPELSQTLVKGIYYCSLTVFNDSINLPIFSAKDCVLMVK